MNVHLRRRLVLVAALLVLAGAAFAVLRDDGSGGKAPVAAATGEVSRERPGGSSLLSALAPLLGAGSAGSARSGSTRASGSGGAAAVPEGERSGKGSNLPVRLDRAVARLFVVGFPGTDPSAPFFERLRVREWGGVLLTADNYVDRDQLATLAGEVGVVARATGLRAPLVVARQAGGEDSAFADLPPTSQFEQVDEADARAQARRAGTELRARGVTMTLAPDADLGAAGGPWDGRAFANDATLVTAMTRAALQGYRAARVVASVGHFPGEGAASGDPVAGPATVGLGLDELRAADVRPFAGVAKVAPVVAMSGALYAAYDGVTPATLLPEAVELLRREVGFDGVVLSADLGAAAFAGGITPGDAAVDALNAGCDLLLLPGDARDQEQALRTVVRAVRRGTVSEDRVRDALARIDALRRAYGVR